MFETNPTQFNIDQYFKENVSRGSVLFSFAIYYTNHNSYTDIIIHKHWHAELEILYINDGTMILEIENKTHHISKGDIIFIPSKLLHQAYADQNKNCSFFATLFSKDLIKSYGNDLIQQKYLAQLLHDSRYISSKDKSYNLMKETLLTIISLFDNKENGFEILIKSKLLEFFYYLFSMFCQETREKITYNKNDILVSIRTKKILSYIETHYQQDISLDEISSQLEITKEHFCRIFKKYFRVSFSEYLTNYRISKAMFLLKNTDWRIIDIALECGFENQNYFSNIFKKITNKTPTEYRKL